MSTGNKAAAVLAAAHAILAARDCCGDERAAAKDALEEAGCQASTEALGEAFMLAGAMWRDAQEAAGVASPVGWEERRRLESTLDPKASE